MIISVTERGTFRRCRRRWDYSSLNRQALEPLVNRPALIVGKLVHNALELWMNDTSLNVHNVYMTLAVRELEAVRRLYADKVGSRMSKDEEDELFSELEFGRNMVTNYVTRWKAPLPPGFELIQTEQQVLVNIPGTEHQLEATFDALVRDKRGKYWILERKTYKARPKEGSLDRNDQFLSYIWALQQLDIGPVGGVLYDGLWKRDKPPRGRKFEDLFLRHTITREQTEIDELESNLTLEAQDMAEARIYPNRQWQGCWDCPFERLCTAQSLDEDVDYIRDTYYVQRSRDDKHYDEVDDGTHSE